MMDQKMSDLLRGSASGRDFFYSLPPEMQISMQPYADLVQNADQLHRFADASLLRRKMAEITGDTDPLL